nr:MAG TPA: hypothetical protein [Caudoviricetes sp.]
MTNPYLAVILKIEKGTAGRRSALYKCFEVIAVLVRVSAVTSFCIPE